MRKLILWAGLITVLNGQAVWAQASFFGLGDLGSGSFSSQAWGISADGSVVVGNGNAASGTEAFPSHGPSHRDFTERPYSATVSKSSLYVLSSVSAWPRCRCHVHVAKNAAA